MIDQPDPDLDLVMPFVTVTSQGGPHDDDAYSAGWEMGQLDAFLTHTQPVFHGQHILAVNAIQADLIAMKHGYEARTVVMAGNPDWSWLELDKAETMPVDVSL